MSLYNLINDYHLSKIEVHFNHIYSKVKNIIYYFDITYKEFLKQI